MSNQTHCWIQFVKITIKINKQQQPQPQSQMILLRSKSIPNKSFDYITVIENSLEKWTKTKKNDDEWTRSLGQLLI